MAMLRLSFRLRGPNPVGSGFTATERRGYNLAAKHLLIGVTEHNTLAQFCGDGICDFASASCQGVDSAAKRAHHSGADEPFA